MIIRFQKQNGLSFRESIKECFDNALKDAKARDESVIITGKFYAEHLDMIKSIYRLIPTKQLYTSKVGYFKCTFVIPSNQLENLDLGGIESA